VSEALFDLITVHCFFVARCQHTEQAADARSAHDAMERHYFTQHRAEISRMVGGWWT